MHESCENSEGEWGCGFHAERSSMQETGDGTKVHILEVPVEQEACLLLAEYSASIVTLT